MVVIGKRNDKAGQACVGFGRQARRSSFMTSSRDMYSCCSEEFAGKVYDVV